MHNTDIKVEIVSTESTGEQKSAEMSMNIDDKFRTKAWLLAMNAKIANINEATE